MLYGVLPESRVSIATTYDTTEIEKLQVILKHLVAAV